MGLRCVDYGKNAPEEFNVIIEIKADSLPVKYEVDKASGALFVDRFLSTSMIYPCNYGYVPETLSDDGDPVDVLVVAPWPVDVGCVITCRAIGMMYMEDEKGMDMKILAVPISSITKLYDHVHKPEDLSNPKLQQIVHFFQHYKDLEEGKWVKVKDKFGGIEAAHKEIEDSIKRHKEVSA